MEFYTDQRPNGAIIVCYCRTPHLLSHECVLFHKNKDIHDTRASSDSSNQRIPIVSADPHEHKHIADKKTIKFFGILAGNPQIVLRNGEYHAYISVQISGITNVTVKNDDLTNNYPGDMISLRVNTANELYEMHDNISKKPEKLQSFAVPQYQPFTFPKMKTTETADEPRQVVGMLLEQGRFPQHKAKILLLPGIRNIVVPPAATGDRMGSSGAQHGSLPMNVLAQEDNDQINLDDYTLGQIHQTFANRSDDAGTKIKSLISTLKQFVDEEIENDEVRQALITTKT